MKTLRAIFRLFLFLNIMAYGVIIVFFTKLFGGNHPDKVMPIMNKCSLWLAKSMGIEMEVTGDLPTEQVLILPNHRSYIDILIFTTWMKGTLVSKASVRKWPVVGRAGHEVWVVYVDRKDPDSRKNTILEIKKRFEMGISVVNFPEGTTNIGPGISELKKGSFYIAAEGGIPVVPVALEFKHQQDAWVGDDTFLPHFIRCFGKKKTPIKVHFGESIRNEDPMVIREEVQVFLERELLRMRTEWDNISPPS